MQQNCINTKFSERYTVVLNSNMCFIFLNCTEYMVLVLSAFTLYIYIYIYIYIKCIIYMHYIYPFTYTNSFRAEQHQKSNYQDNSQNFFFFLSSYNFLTEGYLVICMSPNLFTVNSVTFQHFPARHFCYSIAFLLF